MEVSSNSNENAPKNILNNFPESQSRVISNRAIVENDIASGSNRYSLTYTEGGRFIRRPSNDASCFLSNCYENFKRFSRVTKYIFQNICCFMIYRRRRSYRRRNILKTVKLSENE